MSLWGNIDYVSGNNKPVYANTTHSISNSTINGNKANTSKYYGAVWGVSATEQANTQARADGHHPAHAGWVSQKIGTGPVASITITNGGQGYNSAGFLTISGGGDSTINVSYTIANSLNTLQSFSSNARLNTIATITIVNGGAGFNVAPTVIAGGANIVPATFAVTLGGRAGRVSYETLVSMGSMTLDNSADDRYFPGT
jgi:hypothetical protein